MEFSLIRLLLDFGLVVLIWMVQQLIYPSFLFYNKERLYNWHKKYTQGMFFVVMPLMVGQLAIAFLQLFQGITFFSTTYATVVFSIWVITFLWFVPLHKKISDSESDSATLHKLISRNWLRTILWTLLFMFSLWHFI